MIDFIVKRFLKSDAFFSDVADHNGIKTVFGSFCDASGNELHKCMERADTLIPEGTYKYCFYNSPVNGWVVMLKDVPSYSYIEHHGANTAAQLKGCTAHGTGINVHTPMLTASQAALRPWFDSVVKACNKILAGPIGTIIDGNFGSITYTTSQM